jgi:curved DNA-binding protein CbpA
MDNLTQSIQRYLGRSVSNDSINHYTLLGIELDASTDQVKSALRAAADAWNAADTRSSPQEAQQVAQLLKQAQATLLDANKRILYDKSILAIENKRIGSGLVARVGAWELPEGDPLSPFDPVAFRPKRSPSRFGDATSRWRALEATVFAEESPLALPSMDSQAAVVVGNDASFQSPFSSLSTQFNGEVNRDNQQNASARIKQLRKKRQRNQSLVLGGILLAAVAFLGFASIRFFLHQRNVADRKGVDGNTTLPTGIPLADGKNGESNETSEESKAPVRSSLPSVNKENEANSVGGFDGSPTTMSDDAVMSLKATLPNPDLPADPNPANPTETRMPSLNPAAVSESMASIPMAPAAMPGAKNSAQWAKAMTEGKEALQNLNFDVFGRSMQSALALSTGDDQTAKQKRLDQFGQLYKIAIDAMMEARTKTRGTDVITVGKNRISIVEVKSESVLVRVSGESKTYLWSEVPMGIALGFLDLTLSNTDPTDLAARAVYLSFSTAKTDLHAKRIEEFFSKSIGKGDIRQDLPQALTDTYE